MNAVIIEDDPYARDLLIEVIKSLEENINVVATALTLKHGIQAIETTQPDIVFLDIELPDGKGIDLLDLMDEKFHFETIFTTSHDNYAIEAIRKNAVDYILKPVTKQQLVFAINKVKSRIHQLKKIQEADILKSKLTSLQQNKDENAKILINTMKDGMQIIYAKEVVGVESVGNYTSFHLLNNQKVLSSKTLANFEDKLLGINFFRIHRSFIINLQYIDRIKQDDERGFFVVMKNGLDYDIARRRRKEFLQFFE